VRAESTVAPQALHLLNSAFVHELSAAFAERVLLAAGADPARQVESVYWLAYSRPPTADEQHAAQQALEDLRSKWREKFAAAPPAGEDAERAAGRQALGNFCHAVMNSAGLLFVD
jgi:hypothetical protein